MPEEGKIAEFWTYLENLVFDGTLEGVSLGVSNFRPQDIEEVLRVARIKPVANRECALSGLGRLDGGRSLYGGPDEGVHLWTRLTPRDRVPPVRLRAARVAPRPPGQARHHRRGVWPAHAPAPPPDRRPAQARPRAHRQGARHRRGLRPPPLDDPKGRGRRHVVEAGGEHQEDCRAGQCARPLGAGHCRHRRGWQENPLPPLRRTHDQGLPRAQPAQGYLSDGMKRR